MKLPEGFKAGTVMHGLPRLRDAALVRAVVHDGNTGMDGENECARVGAGHSVVRDEIEIDPADG
ncbi:MAG: hypothetical protein ACRD27_03620, partial [Terracidiphilus sp.]